MRLYCVKLDATLAFPNCKLNLVALRSVIEHRAPKSAPLDTPGTRRRDGPRRRVATLGRARTRRSGAPAAPQSAHTACKKCPPRPHGLSCIRRGATDDPPPVPLATAAAARGVEIPLLLGRRASLHRPRTPGYGGGGGEGGRGARGRLAGPPPRDLSRPPSSRPQIPLLLGRRGESPPAPVPLATAAAAARGRDPEPSGAAGRVSTSPVPLVTAAAARGVEIPPPLGAAGRVSTAPRTPGHGGGGEGGRDPAPSRGGGASLHRPPSRSFWGDGASFHRAPYPWLRRRRRRGVEIPLLLGRRGESPPAPYPLATGGGGEGGRDPEPSGAAGRVSTGHRTPGYGRRRQGG
eukprot:tig00000526_g1905.t1